MQNFPRSGFLGVWKSQLRSLEQEESSPVIATSYNDEFTNRILYLNFAIIYYLFSARYKYRHFAVKKGDEVAI